MKDLWVKFKKKHKEVIEDLQYACNIIASNSNGNINLLTLVNVDLYNKPIGNTGAMLIANSLIEGGQILYLQLGWL